MIDLTNLHSITEDSPELLDTLLEEFLNTTQADIKALEDAVHNDEANTIASLAHRIKGSSMIVGADELTQLTQQLEEAGQRKSSDRFPALFADVSACYSQVSQAIRDL